MIKRSAAVRFETFKGPPACSNRKVLKFGTIVPIDESELNELMRIKQNNLPAGTKSIQNQALTKTPDVRAENVARGKALIADPNYPSQEQIKKIANLLAANWERANSSSQLLGVTTLWPDPQRSTRRHSARNHVCVCGDRRRTRGEGRTAQASIG